MRNSLLTTLALLLLTACSVSRKSSTQTQQAGNVVQATIDLVQVQNDQVKVSVAPPAIATATIQYQLPRIIPGTYSIADYGRFVENFKAYDQSGKELTVVKKDVNTWEIQNATSLKQVSYVVNDTYDCEEGNAFDEGSKTIFSPAGTNILANRQFMLNLCGFVGYFSDRANLPYQLRVTHPAQLQASSALDDTDPAADADLFQLTRYAEVVDNPIMYCVPDVANAQIGGMDLLLSVYSPRKKSISAAAFMPDLERMISAQKNYMGAINKTKKYAVLAYITTNGKEDARGIGALEHNTSTTATFLETMKSKDLIHVISHEFFHTLTPLNVHSKEIHDFDFNDPKMSKHLWMYEGFTEYFANHFQVHEGLITPDQFYAKMAEKEKNSLTMFNDKLSFTEMSKQVLDSKMKAQYPNVYEKGALMAMCLDILLREQSGGKKGVLELMGRLSEKYGPNRPFNDDDLIPEITAMTSPEVGLFLQEHVVKGVPVPYETYLAKVGVTRASMPVPTMVIFMNGKGLNIKLDTVSKTVKAVMPQPNNAFFTALGVEDGDELLELNETPIDASSPTSVLMSVYGIDEGEPIVMKVRRNGVVKELKGTARLNYVDGKGFKFTDESKRALNTAWLKG